MDSFFDYETILRNYIASERREAREEAGILMLRNLTLNTGVSLSRAMELLSILAEERPRDTEILEQQA